MDGGLVLKLKEEISHFKISCKRGCSNCCKVSKVAVTDKEIDVLFNKLNAKDKQYLKRQHKDFENNKRCVFLKDNLCRVYEDRPLMCVKHVVNSNPDLCLKGKGNVLKTSLEREISELYKERKYLHNELHRRLK